MAVALITGAAGQDGLYLARYLRHLGYVVVGLVQYGNEHERRLVRTVVGDIELVTGDVTDLASLVNALRHVQPDEIYNLAAISSVRLAWDQPARTAEVNGAGLVNLLEAVRAVMGPRQTDVRVFQASSTQIFGEPAAEWVDEETPVRPTSPYGASKAFAHFTADAYRRRFGLFVACGILGNHESPLHDEEFAVPRITRAARRIAAGSGETLVLDNLTATRDWGFAGDYVAAMHRALQRDTPEDFVIATGELRSVEDVVSTAFAAAGITDWRPHVRTSQAQHGRTHRGVRGNAGRARRLLGWAPRVGFEALVQMMVADTLGAVYEPPADARVVP